MRDAVWFDLVMGMADDIRRKQQSEASERQQAERLSLEARERMTTWIDRAVAEVVDALTELQTKPTVKAGFMKKGWKLDVPFDLKIEHRRVEPILVLPDGTWKFYRYWNGKPITKGQMKEQWLYSGSKNYLTEQDIRASFMKQLGG